jgi:alpha-1,2-rhamnosyltransferase
VIDTTTNPRPATSISLDRISIDVTETVLTGKWTGIERVVRRLSTELQAAHDTGQGPGIRLVVAIGGRFHELNEAGASQMTRPAGATRTQQGSGATRLVGTALSYVPPLLLRVQSALKERQIRAVLRPLATPGPAEFGHGDLILLLDSYWSGTSSIHAARDARSAGATVVSTIYDLIPITHPGYMTRSLRSSFPRQILQALRISDGAIAISQHSADELRRWLGRRLPDLPIRAFALGNDPTAPGSTADRPLSRRYTMIGTIEPRKGHDLVLDAFERRWAAGVDCHLTLVGKIGWAAPSTLARLAALQANARLTVKHDADDAELASILAQSDAVIMASKVEGFGLPVVEALALDIPVIASDIAIFREIGGNAIIPFDPDSSGALVAAMETLEADYAHYRRVAQGFTWPSWKTAARGLTTTLDELARNRPRRANP